MPLCYAICGRLLLQAFQNGLVLHCDFHQLVLSLHTVQTCFLYTHGVVEVRLWVLHNVRHFLEQDAVLPLDLSIAS